MEEAEDIAVEITFDCVHCGKIVKLDDVMKFNDKVFCQSCYDDTTCPCHNCNDRYETEDMYAVQNRRGREVMVCEQCYNDDYCTCDDCGAVIHSDNTLYGNNERTICQGCYADHYFTCRSCDRILHNDYYSNDGYCEDCCDDEDTSCEWINEDHSANPFDYAKNANLVRRVMEDNPNGPFMGVELEVSAKYEVSDCAYACHETLRDIAVLKRDGSVDDGFEICSLPYTLEDHQTSPYWGQFFDKVAPSTIITDSYRHHCGIHIHVNRKCFSHAGLTRFIAFVHSRENDDFITTIAERDPNNYCQRNAKNPDTHEHYEKYEAVALHKRNTVEVRIFASYVERGRFFKNLEFVDALRVYCNADNHDKDSYEFNDVNWFLSVSKSLHWRKFADFVLANIDKYPNLSNWIVEKCGRVR